MTQCSLDDVDRIQLKFLWKQAFHDRDCDIDAFFSTLFSPENTPFLRQDGKIVSAAYLVDIKLSNRTGEKPFSGYYFCCAATLEESRGQGYMTRVLQQVEQMAVARKKDFVVLIPANDGLFSFYQKSGYKDFFWCGQPSVPACPQGKFTFCPPEGIGAEVLSGMQQKYAREHPCFAIKNEKILQYSLIDARLSGYKVWLIFRSGQKQADGYLVAQPGEENHPVLIREIVLSGGEERLAAGEFAAFLGESKVEARLPCKPGTGRRKGMILPLASALRTVQPDKLDTLPFLNHLMEA